MCAMGTALWLRAYVGRREPTYQGRTESYWVNNLSPQFSEQVLRALGSNAVPVLLKAIQRRESATTRLYNNIWPKLPQKLKGRLSPPTNPSQIRTNAALLLMNTADAGTLTHVLTNHFDPIVRYVAANGLMQKRSPDVTAALVVALNDSDTRVRRAAVLSLSTEGRDESITTPAIAGSLQDPDPGVRLWAGSTLLDRSNGVDLAFLEIKKAATSTTPDVRRAAEAVLKQQSPDETLKTYTYAAHLGYYEQSSPRWTATIKVTDEKKAPVVDAVVKTYYSIPAPPGESFAGTNISGLTDARGICTASKQANSADLLFEASKPGYYSSRQSYELAFTTDPIKLSTTQTLVLKKVVSPTPMCVSRIDLAHQKRPAFETPLGLDLVSGDWVAPYGKGSNADLLITFHKIGDDKTGEDQWIISFPNPADGIQEFDSPPGSPAAQSDLRSPYEAPLDGYQPKLVRARTWHPGSAITSTFAPHKNYILRFHTSLDEKGNIKAANYGKIYGEFDSYFWALVNPEPNSRNIESDPSRNLPRTSYANATVGPP